MRFIPTFALCSTGHTFSQRSQASSAGSIDGGLLATQSLGHQRVSQPSQKLRVETSGTEPHRRDDIADGEKQLQDDVLL